MGYRIGPQQDRPRSLTLCQPVFDQVLSHAFLSLHRVYRTESLMPGSLR